MAGTRLDPRRQAALLNNHLSLENKVDIAKIWPALADAFTKDEQREIQYGRDSNEQMKRLVDLLPFKNDDAFDQLVAALRKDYRWLAARLEQSVKDENDRVERAGRGRKDPGVRRKVALALLTTRISERQKDHVIDSMAEVLEDELRDRTIKQSMYDQQALVDVNEIGEKLKRLINDHLDPIIRGHGTKTDLQDEDAAAVVRKLEAMLEELEAIEECYQTLDVGSGPSTPRSMPVLLKQKIDETRTTIQILEERNKQLAAEKLQVEQHDSRQDQALMTIQSKNRNLELENRTLETEVRNLQLDLTQLSEEKTKLEREVVRLDTDNIKLHGQLVQQENESENVYMRIRRLDEANLRLTRENKKLNDSLKVLRHNARNRHNARSAQLAAENKELVAERQRLQTDIRRLDGEKGQLLIKNQRLQAENEQLQEQKRRLVEDKKRLSQQNKELRQEAKRLALGKYEKIQDLTPPDSKERDDHRSTRLPPIRDEDDGNRRDGDHDRGRSTRPYKSQSPPPPRRRDPSPETLRREGARRSQRSYMPSRKHESPSPRRDEGGRQSRRNDPTPTRNDPAPKRRSRNDNTPTRNDPAPKRRSRNDPSPTRNDPAPKRRSRNDNNTPTGRSGSQPPQRNSQPSRRNDPTPSRRNDPSPSQRNTQRSRRDDQTPTRRNDPAPAGRNTRQQQQQQQQQQSRKNDRSPAGRGGSNPPPGGRNDGGGARRGGQPSKSGSSPSRVPAATKTVSNGDPRATQPADLRRTNRMWQSDEARQKNAISLVKEANTARRTGAPPANSSKKVPDRLPPISSNNRTYNAAAARTQNPAGKQEKTRPPVRV